MYSYKGFRTRNYETCFFCFNHARPNRGYFKSLVPVISFRDCDSITPLPNLANSSQRRTRKKENKTKTQPHNEANKHYTSEQVASKITASATFFHTHTHIHTHTYTYAYCTYIMISRARPPSFKLHICVGIKKSCTSNKYIHPVWTQIKVH